MSNGEKPEELKRCKRHKVLPLLREVKPSDNPYINSPLHHMNPYLNSPLHHMGHKQFEYVCEACEVEKQMARRQPLIDKWNRDQDEAEHE